MPDHRPTLAELARRLDEQAAEIAELRRQLTGGRAPDDVQALKKAAWLANVDYQKAARWCRRGLVGATRIGGRLYASPQELAAHARRLGDETK
jgi:hypothetical protein